MMKELWKLFPRHIEQRINALLDEAEPSRMKAFQIYKTCQNENLWRDSFAMFSDHLNEFFALPKSERSKSRFDYFLEQPMHKSIFENFQLDFRSAVVNNRSLLMVASWAHNLMRTNCPGPGPVISTEVMTRTLNSITNPPLFEKVQDIDFEDFCNAWKRTVFSLFGKKYDAELESILEELQLLNIENRNVEHTQRFVGHLYMTQTEIDWTSRIMTAAREAKELPHYPLLRGPQKQPLVELLRIVQLYNIVFGSTLPDLVRHQANVRATILDRCQGLLRDRAV